MTPRRQRIMEQLHAGREVSVEALAQEYGVSLVTIRRDLDALAQDGSVTRTHGGAVLSRAGVVEFSFLTRAQEQLEPKRAIARYVAGTVEPGMTIVLDTGTTTLEVARAIGGIQRLCVLTSSLAIASALHARDNVDLVLLGGSVRHSSPDLFGPLTEANLRQFCPDRAIIGADAADPRGAYTSDLGVAAVSRAMIVGARETWLVADHSKFSRQAFVQFASWEAIDHLVTDSALPAAEREWVASVTSLHIAPRQHASRETKQCNW